MISLTLLKNILIKILYSRMKILIILTKFKNHSSQNIPLIIRNLKLLEKMKKKKIKILLMKMNIINKWLVLMIKERYKY